MPKPHLYMDYVHNYEKLYAIREAKLSAMKRACEARDSALATKLNKQVALATMKLMRISALLSCSY